MTQEKKFIAIADNVSLYKSGSVTNIIIENSDLERGKNFFSYYSINESGKTLLQAIRGDETINSFIIRFCRENSLVFDSDQEWISTFLLEMIQKRVLTSSNIPVLSDSIEVLGETTLATPMHFTFEITEKCNLYCSHCYLSAACQKETRITFLNFKKIVKKLKEKKVATIELTGGEFFMHPEALEFLELALNEFGHVAVLTNGTILPKKAIDLMSRNKDRLVVSISLDSAREEIHDNFRGQKGAFRKTCSNIKKLTNSGIFVRVASSIFDGNMWEIDKIADLSVSLGARFFSYNFIEDFGRAKGFKKNNFENKSYAQEYLDYISSVMEKYKDIIPIVETESHLRASENCGAGINSVLVGANGDIRPCALFPKTTLFGNVFRERYDDIFKKDIFKEISSVVPPGEKNGCPRSCEYFYHCSGCYMKGFEKNSGRDDYCNWITKNGYSNLLSRYLEGRLAHD